MSNNIIDNIHFISNSSYEESIYNSEIPVQQNPLLGTILYNSDYNQSYIPVVSSSSLLYSLFLNIDYDRFEDEFPNNFFVYDLFGSNEIYLPPPPSGHAYSLNEENRINFLKLFYYNFNTEEDNKNIRNLISNNTFPSSLLSLYVAPVTLIKFKVLEKNSNIYVLFYLDDFFTLTEIQNISTVQSQKSIPVSSCKYLTISNKKHSFISSNYPYANLVDNIPICSNPNLTDSSNHPTTCPYYYISSITNDFQSFLTCNHYSANEEIILDKIIYLDSNSSPVRISLSKSISLNNNELYKIHNHTENITIFDFEIDSEDKNNIDLNSIFSEIISCYNSNNIESFKDDVLVSTNSYLSQFITG
jgi:hypothetical protein